MKRSLTLLVSAITLGNALSTHAQIPIIGDLLGGASLDAALLETLPLGQLGGANPLGDLSGSLDGVLFAGQLLLPALEDIPKLVPTGLDISLVQGFVPVLDVAFNKPIAIPQYLLSGGTLLSSALAPLPALPIVSLPLSGAGDLGNLFATDVLAGLLPAELLQPDAVLSTLLEQVSAGSALLPPVSIPL